MRFSVTSSVPKLIGRPQVWLLGFIAVLSPAVFALTTNNIWEDFFITFRCSLNLAHGNGLVYEIGRTVHVFTSPLGTLIPAGISYVLSSDDPQVVIDVFRLLGCLLLFFAFMVVISRTEKLVALAITAGFWLLDGKLAAFSTNGMETALLVFFVVLAWRALVDGEMRMAGVALGGALWIRPDGFIFIGALAASTWILQRGWRPDWGGFAKMSAWGLVVYAPWFLWAWYYYGSPIPHTIIAKSNFSSNSTASLSVLISYPIRLLFGRTAADESFLPAYFYLGGWPNILLLWSKAMTLGVVITVVWPTCSRATRIAGLAFLLGGLYLEITPRAPWYFPAWAVLAYIALSGLASRFVETKIGRSYSGKLTAIIIGSILILTQGAVFIAMSIQLRTQQQLIENGIRTTIGRDLSQLARNRLDTVFLEPLGYIGYYSGLAMRDTPGLCSPEVVAVRRSGKTSMPELAMSMAADWVVLRGWEFTLMTAEQHSRFDELYCYVGKYDVRSHVEAVEFLPGRGFLLYDSLFLLWRRRKLEAAMP